MALAMAELNVTFQNAWARDPGAQRGTQKDHRAERRRGKKAQEDALFSRERWVFHCATGSNCIAQVLPKRQGEEEMWDGA